MSENQQASQDTPSRADANRQRARHTTCVTGEDPQTASGSWACSCHEVTSAVTAWLWGFAVFVILYVACAIYALRFPSAAASMLVFPFAILGAVAAMYLVFAFSDVSVNWRCLVVAIFAGAAVDFLGNVAAPERGGGGWIDTAALISCIGLANLGMLMAATAIGLLMSLGVRNTSYLVLAALAGALADSFSVFGGGPTSRLSETKAVFYLALQWAYPGPAGRNGLAPIIGMGDFIFLALYFAGARKLGWNAGRTLWAMIIAFLVGFASHVHMARGLPALPFMAAALLIAHRKDLQMTRQEWLTVFRLVLILGGLLTLLVLKPRFV